MRWKRWIPVGAVVVVMVATAAGVAARQGIEPPPVTTFYDAPSEIPQEPGSLIRWEAIDAPSRAGDASLYRILYTSRDLNGEPIAVSGALAIPGGAAPAQGWPLVASAHGMVGAARNCAPSLALFQELEGQSFWTMQLEPYLKAGYAVVMPDYQGAGAAGPASNVVGIVEAHDVLDAVRAARAFPDARVSDETFLWGHSQGGHAALFTNAMAGQYAPEITFQAVAVLAPAVDLRGIFAGIVAADKPVTRSVLGLIVARAWTDTYPGQKLEDILTPEGVAAVKGTVDHFCIPWVGVPARLFAPKALIKADAVQTWSTLIDENTPGAQPDGTPLFIGHGEDDEVIPIAGSEQYVTTLCAAGNRVVFKTYPKATHFSVVADATQDVLDFYAAVRAGKPVATTCTSSP